jgi:DNA-binding GntR family transcriptional regulator
MAGRRLASNITDAQLQELHAMLDELQASPVNGELNNCFTLNIAFYDRMREVASFVRTGSASF